MRSIKINGWWMVAAAMVAGVMAMAVGFTDVDAPGRTGAVDLPGICATLDANFALLESGGVDVSVSALSVASNKFVVGNDSNNGTAMGITGDVTITQDGTNVTTAIASGAIVNADVNGSAAIAYSKLALSGSIVNADVKTNAAIALSKLANSVTITTITNVVGGVTNTYNVLTATP